MAALSKSEYLKRYLSDDKKSKKKKKSLNSKLAQDSRYKIVDDDVNFKSLLPSNLHNTLDEDIDDNSPVVVAVVDERPLLVQQLEKYHNNDRWRTVADGVTSKSSKVNVGSDSKTSRTQVSHQSNLHHSSVSIQRHDLDSYQSSARTQRHDSDSDQSPARTQRHDSDSDQSPARTQRHDSDSDQSPARTQRHDSDSDQSPIRTQRHDSDSDQSPARIQKHDSDADQSPVRIRHNFNESPRRTQQKSKYVQSPRRKHKLSDSDQSPQRKHKQSDSDQSPQRKHIQSVSDQSPRRKHKKSDSDQSPKRKQKQSDSRGRATHTLGGATAGLSTANEMKREAAELRKKQDQAFSEINAETLGKGANTVHRDKSGRRRNLVAEQREKDEAAAKQQEVDEKYAQWGKGMKQQEDASARASDAIHEASKPLARYRDDDDLDRMMRELQRDGDPMMAFMKTKPKNCDAKERPKYRGNAPPNRFSIRPGYRWDGVDRSNGFEKKLFMKQSDRKAMSMDAYKWSTEDM